jgi:aspartokinase-like uncharacterized kinase
MSLGWQEGSLVASAPPVAGPLGVKVGGSLLTRPDWAAGLAALLEPLTAPLLIVVGGGPLVDALRAIDARSPQPAAVMHELAIDTMGVTARLMAAALGVPLVIDAPRRDAEAPIAVLDAPAWLRHGGRLAVLPVGWHVTSDSIAAFVASRCGGRLLLVKSVPPPIADLTSLGEAGWVDRYFPTASLPLTSIMWAAPTRIEP